MLHSRRATSNSSLYTSMLRLCSAVRVSLLRFSRVRLVAITDRRRFAFPTAAVKLDLVCDT